MDIIQPLFFIPPDIEAKLATGEFIRYGGVVRNLSGQIVKHLKEIQLPDESSEAAQAGIARVLKNPKTIVIGLTVVTITAAVGGTVAYLSKRNRQSGEEEIPPSVQNFNASLTHYLESASNGSLDSEIIDKLIADLDAVKAETEDGTITVEFLPEHSEALVTIVADHTRRLAEANQVDVANLPDVANSDGAAIIDLRPYLEVQRELFSREG